MSSRNQSSASTEVASLGKRTRRPNSRYMTDFICPIYKTKESKQDDVTDPNINKVQPIGSSHHVPVQDGKDTSGRDDTSDTPRASVEKCRGRPRKRPLSVKLSRANSPTKSSTSADDSIKRKKMEKAEGHIDGTHDQANHSPPNSPPEEQEEFLVHRVLDEKVEFGVLMYSIHWDGYTKDESTWEKLENLSNCQDKLTEYLKKKVARSYIIASDLTEPQATEDDIEHVPKRHRYRVISRRYPHREFMLLARKTEEVLQAGDFNHIYICDDPDTKADIKEKKPDDEVSGIMPKDRAQGVDHRKEQDELDIPSRNNARNETSDETDYMLEEQSEKSESINSPEKENESSHYNHMLMSVDESAGRKDMATLPKRAKQASDQLNDKSVIDVKNVITPPLTNVCRRRKIRVVNANDRITYLYVRHTAEEMRQMNPHHRYYECEASEEGEEEDDEENAIGPRQKKMF